MVASNKKIRLTSFATLLSAIKPVRILAVCFCCIGLTGCPKQPSNSSGESFDNSGQNSSSPGGDPSTQTASDIRFESRIDHSNLTTAYQDGQQDEVFSIVESLGGGVAVFDFDNDNRLDLAFAGGGQFPNGKSITGVNGGLYRGSDSWKFDDCTDLSQFDVSEFYHHSILAADFNNDGFEDLMIPGFGGFTLLENMGDGTFRDVAMENGFVSEQWNTSGAWFDFDNDGDLDFYCCRYADWSIENNPECRAANGNRDVCGPRDFEPVNDSLFVSDGAGKFIEYAIGGENSDAAFAMGLASGGRGLGVLAADIDLDGDTDLYVSNDELANFLYRNEFDASAPDQPKLKEMGVRAGAALDDKGGPDGSMGIGVGDFNNDSQMDLFVTHYETETCALYRNAGRMNFIHASRRANINSMGNLFVAWGTSFEDFDLDGDQDILVVNGHAVRESTSAPTAQKPVLMENRNAKSYERIFEFGNFSQQARNARGLAIADFDGDGKMDFVSTEVNARPVLERNQSKTNGNYLKIKLVGRSANRNAIGATVKITSGTNSLVRPIYGGGSYAGTSQRVAHFGLADLPVDSLTVLWPGGRETTLTDIDLNQTLLIVEDVN